MGGKRFRVIEGSPKTRASDDGYHFSTLHKWFRLDTWTDKEAICLICDIDPAGAEIDWFGNPIAAGLVQHVPIIKQAQLLSEGSSFYKTPREQLNPVEKEITASIIRLEIPDFSSDQLEPSSKVYEKNIKLEAAQERLQQIWSIYSRASDKGIGFGKERPSWYVNWALRRDINIGWLDWAEHNGYLVRESEKTQPDTREPVATRSRKKISANTPERHQENEQEIKELRARAKKIAIKLKIDGIHQKYITVKRVCEDLLKEDFSSGKSFASRWGTVDGMRSYLKGKHHPKKNSEFRNTRSTRSKFNH